MWEKLAKAIERKDVATAKQLLKQYPELVRSKNYQDETLLHLAAVSGSAEIVADLLVRGSRPDAPDDFGCTPLHEACSKGHEEVVALFLQLPFNLEGASKKQETALHLATRNGFAGIVSRLLKAGANHGSRNQAGNTPLHVAALAGRLDIMKNLHERGADITAKNLTGDTPLHEAGRGGWVEVAEWCLANGADPEDQNRDDRSFIDVAMREGRQQFINHFANLEQPISTPDEPNPLTSTGIRLLVAKDAQTMAKESTSPIVRIVRSFYFGKCRISEATAFTTLLETWLWFCLFPMLLFLLWQGFSQNLIPRLAIFPPTWAAPHFVLLSTLIHFLLVFLASHLLISSAKAGSGLHHLIWNIRSSVVIRVLHFALIDAFFIKNLKFDNAFWEAFSRFWLWFLLTYCLGFAYWWFNLRLTKSKTT